MAESVSLLRIYRQKYVRIKKADVSTEFQYSFTVITSQSEKIDKCINVLFINADRHTKFLNDLLRCFTLEHKNRLICIHS
jgi:hypothetical protein